LVLGPEGYLYAALGDGGSPGDELNNAQNIQSLLGKILRLDVRSDGFPDDPGRNYAIPSDNPFVGRAGADEIWALGLRNPWRDGFDRGLGDLYIADVGENRWEEINIGEAGANYGWRMREGPSVFSGDTASGGGILTNPIHSYGHSLGDAVTGGYVYRGPSEGLHGHYFFADSGSGRIFTLKQVGNEWIRTERTSDIVFDAGSIDIPVSFGEDARGNLYVVDYDGEIFKLTPKVVSADQADHLEGFDGTFAPTLCSRSRPTALALSAAARARMRSTASSACSSTTASLRSTSTAMRGRPIGSIGRRSIVRPTRPGWATGSRSSTPARATWRLPH
jgi:hypothetical protein